MANQQTIEHKSIHDYRLEHDKRGLEKAFAENWIHQNEQNYYLSLLLQKRGYMEPGLFWRPRSEEVPFEPISQRDATVAATVLQWLGTNVGFCFLEESLKKSGYKITKIQS